MRRLTVVGLEQLGDDEEVLALAHTLREALLQRLPDLGLVAVASGAVDETISARDGSLDGSPNLAGLGREEGAEAEAGDGGAGLEGDGAGGHGGSAGSRVFLAVLGCAQAAQPGLLHFQTSSGFIDFGRKNTHAADLFEGRSQFTESTEPPALSQARRHCRHTGGHCRPGRPQRDQNRARAAQKLLGLLDSQGDLDLRAALRDVSG